MRPVHFAAARRTPIGKLRGALSGVRPDDLAAAVIRGLVAGPYAREGSAQLADGGAAGGREVDGTQRNLLIRRPTAGLPLGGSLN